MRSARYQIPPLEPLLAFEAAARHLSFTKAGEELFLTQSAVSRQIQQLEDNLGGKLFERRTRALLLTENGRALYRVTQDVLQKLHDSAEQLRGATQARTVMLSTTPGFASLWLIPRLAGFTRDHPDVDVRISASNDKVDLERAGIDIAVRYVPPASAEGATLLFGEEVLPVCSPALAADPRRPLVEPSDLRRHVLLHLDDPRAAWLDWNLWLHALDLHAMQPAGTLHFNQYDQLIHAAIAGQGVALGRVQLMRQLLRDGTLVAPFKKAIVSTRAYFLLQSARGARKPEVREFASWLLAETARQSSLESATLQRSSKKINKINKLHNTPRNKK